MGRLGNIGKIGFKAVGYHRREDQKEPLIMRGEAFESVGSVTHFPG